MRFVDVPFVFSKPGVLFVYIQRQFVYKNSIRNQFFKAKSGQKLSKTDCSDLWTSLKILKICKRNFEKKNNKLDLVRFEPGPLAYQLFYSVKKFEDTNFYSLKLMRTVFRGSEAQPCRAKGPTYLKMSALPFSITSSWFFIVFCC